MFSYQRHRFTKVDLNSPNSSAVHSFWSDMKEQALTFKLLIQLSSLTVRQSANSMTITMFTQALHPVCLISSN